MYFVFISKIKEKQHHELKELRVNLKKCFKVLNCYLMPHPGLKVCTSPEFEGKLKGPPWPLLNARLDSSKPFFFF
jgi:hypothetical protein